MFCTYPKQRTTQTGIVWKTGWQFPVAVSTSAVSKAEVYPLAAFLELIAVVPQVEDTITFILSPNTDTQLVAVDIIKLFVHWESPNCSGKSRMLLCALNMWRCRVTSTEFWSHCVNKKCWSLKSARPQNVCQAERQCRSSELESSTCNTRILHGVQTHYENNQIYNQKIFSLKYIWKL